MTANGKKILDIIYYILTAFLVVILGISILQYDIQILTDYAFNLVFIPWFLILMVKLKIFRDKKRKQRIDYKNKLEDRIRTRKQ